MKEGWEYKKLGDTLFFDKRFQGLNGCKQEKIVSFSHVSAEELKNLVDENGDVRLLSTGNFSGYTTKEKAGSSLNCGEVITIPTGGTANIKYYNGLFVDSGNIIGIASNASIVLRFIYYAMIANNDTINSYYRGASIKHPYMPDIYKIPIPVPSKFEQQRIVDELDLLSSIIEKKKTQLNELENLAQSLFYEMFGDPITNEKGWKVKNLGEICEIVRGGSPRPIDKFLGGNIPWIKIGDATKGDDIYLNSTKEHIIEEGLKKTRYIPKGSLIFANCGVSLGFARIIQFDGCIHDGWLALMNINENKINKVFLLKSLNFCTTYFRKLAPDGTQPNLNTSIMKLHKQILPPITLQDTYVVRLRRIEHQKTLIQKSIEQVETLFNSRMDYYFN